tara:strand:- start:206 stop:475 length:270 start_codon:yes stop_codon:yes gene_type:complete
MKETEENSYIALLKKTKSEIQQDKLIEGCCVLSSILMQQRNHPHRNLTVEVEDGLASVLLWADLISLGYDEERINKRIANKLKKHKKIL